MRPVLPARVLPGLPVPRPVLPAAVLSGPLMPRPVSSWCSVGRALPLRAVRRLSLRRLRAARRRVRPLLPVGTLRHGRSGPPVRVGVRASLAVRVVGILSVRVVGTLSVRVVGALSLRRLR
ncbi:hypothetical protein [Sphaerisporangium krabiense]|uniref:Uncharacterized protein n=2 Tax=Sphaerisporangium krabiense TaxID=763782 RepID=A0A7W8ZB99_9ACTN|nr:hypothetical protein [Sphaerisporangium krabiense]MBB5630843.1 hypothetical protein [Sphaerisporangium krabiense]